MISIVICARTPELKPELAENLRELIGCEYEVVVIDNSENRYSIFEAYNLGIDRSRGKIICFMHDDVLMRTKDWGPILQQIFNDNPQAGLVGVSGGRFKSRMPSAWWDCPREMYEMNVFQHFQDREPYLVKRGFREGNISEVAAIDGLFMALRRSTGIRMNTTLKGFHCYDVSLSIECRKRGYRTYSTCLIMPEHLSGGTLNNSWYDATFIMHKLYKDDLPLTVQGFDDPKLIKQIEFENGMRMINKLRLARYRRWMIVPIWIRMIWMKPLAKAHVSIFKLILLTLMGRESVKAK